MNKFKAGDKVKRVAGCHEGMRVGDTAVVRCLEGPCLYLDGYKTSHNPKIFELVQDDKESIKQFLKENKWFIRTGSPEKSELVQEWLFEHGCEWWWGKKVQTGFNDELITNTNCVGFIEKYIMFSMNDNKSNAEEIKIEFGTIIKNVQLPEIPPKKTEQQLRIEELEATIAQASAQIKQLKEEM